MQSEVRCSAGSPAAIEGQRVKGAGFWIRALAHGIDLAIVVSLAVMATVPLLLRALSQGVMGVLRIPLAVEIGIDVAFACGVIAMWRITQTTPGKKLLGLRIVDWRTGERPGWGQLAVRYLAYLIAYVPFPPRLLTLWWPGLEDSRPWGPLFQSWLFLLPLGWGFLWVMIDPRNRGWHDLLSGTVTVSTRQGNLKRCQDEETCAQGRLIEETEKKSG